MNKSSALPVCAAIGLTLNVGLHASDTASATVTFSIHPINVIQVNDNPTVMAITSMPPGNHVAVCHVTTSAFAVTTNMSSQRITACLDSPMPPGLRLSIRMEAPEGAVSMGSVPMSTDDRILVTGVSHIAESNLGVRYSLHATMEAFGQNASRIVTYTIVP